MVVQAVLAVLAAGLRDFQIVAESDEVVFGSVGSEVLSVVSVVSGASRGADLAVSVSRGRCRAFVWRWGVCMTCVRGVLWVR